jgi:hypothetical protein
MREQPFSNQLIAGDTWDWSISLPDYSPADGYVLKYFFRGPGTLDLTATTDTAGTGFKVSRIHLHRRARFRLGLTSSKWRSFLGTAKTELDRGTLEILADISAKAAGSETRSFVKITLDAIRAVLQGRATRVEQEYMVNGRQARLMSVKELIEAEGIFAARYRREQIESGELPPNTNEVRAAFGDPTDPVLTRMWKNFPGSGA